MSHALFVIRANLRASSLANGPSHPSGDCVKNLHLMAITPIGNKNLVLVLDNLLWRLKSGGRHYNLFPRKIERLPVILDSESLDGAISDHQQLAIRLEGDASEFLSLDGGVWD